MKRTLIIFFTLLVFGSLAVSAEIELDVKEHVLSNGLKILMIQNPGVPRVVCHIYYKVGSINEKPGITGLAHMHEHMMFKGTKVSGVTDYEKDHALNLRIDELIDKIYREKFWKSDGGDKEKITEWQKEYEGLIQEEHRLPLFNISAIINFGSLYVSQDKKGLASIMSQTMIKGGTKTREGRDIEDRINFIGGGLSFRAGERTSTLSLNVLSEDLDEGLEIFFDVLVNPQFRRGPVALAKASSTQRLR